MQTIQTKLDKLIQTNPDLAYNVALNAIKFVFQPTFPFPDIREKIQQEFNNTHTDLLKTHKVRFRQEDELFNMENSGQRNTQKIKKKTALVASLKAEYDIKFQTFLNARRAEEFTRSFNALMTAHTQSHDTKLTATLLHQVFKEMLVTCTWSKGEGLSKYESAFYFLETISKLDNEEIQLVTLEPLNFPKNMIH